LHEYIHTNQANHIIYNNLTQSAIESLLAMCIVHSTSVTSSTIAATMDIIGKLGITLPKSIIQKIDNKRGDIPGSRYTRRAIERHLGNSSSKNIGNDSNAAAATKKGGGNRKMSSIENSIVLCHKYYWFWWYRRFLGWFRCAGSSTASTGAAATSNANSPTNTQTVIKARSTTHGLVQ
jgi:hypothetical protein